MQVRRTACARRTRQSGMRDRKQRRRARGQVSQAAGRGPSPCCRTHRCTQRQAPCPPSRGVGRCAPRGPFNGVGMSARPVLNRRSRQRLVHGGTEGRIAGPCRSDGQQWGLARSPRTSRAAQKRPALLSVNSAGGDFPASCMAFSLSWPAAAGVKLINAGEKRRVWRVEVYPGITDPSLCALARRVEAASSKVAAGAVTARPVARERNARRSSLVDDSASVA